jgi:hypothetical protein
MMRAMRALGLLAAGILACSPVVAEVADSGAPDATEATVTVTIEGPGTVTSDPAGLDACRGTCIEGFPLGTSVVLTATPLPGGTFLGWAGTGCTGVGTCTVNTSSNAVVVASFDAPNYVFVTSTKLAQPFGGLAGADARCNELAEEGGLPGTYVAYLSTSSTDPLTRLAGSRGWIRTDGKPFVDTLADLEVGHILHPPQLDELGRPFEEEAVVTLTGTGTNGRLQGSTCADWTDATLDENPLAGEPSAGSAMFSLTYLHPCGQPAHLYCFGVGVDRALPPSSVSGRMAFLSNDGWTPDGSVAGADSLCQGEATTAGLPGTYKAFLATSGASAVSRFDMAGLPWVRPDGYPLAPTATETFTRSHLDVSVNITADGASFVDNYCVWSGAQAPNLAGGLTSTCQNWSTTDATGRSGLAGLTRLSAVFGQFTPVPCVNPCKLICLQE